MTPKWRPMAPESAPANRLSRSETAKTLSSRFSPFTRGPFRRCPDFKILFSNRYGIPQILNLLVHVKPLTGLHDVDFTLS
jgi:hypothetical protein